MRLTRSLRLSVRALAAQPWRTGLSVAGSAVGIAGVLLLTAIGHGTRMSVLAQIDALGRNVVVVTPPPVDARARLVRRGAALTPPLRLGDAEALLRATPAVLRAAPAADRDLFVRRGRRSVRVGVIGTTPSWVVIRQFEISEGRFFSESEEGEFARVAVLGASTRALLFPNGTPAIDSTVTVGTVPFRVVGALAPKGLSAAGTATEDDKIIIPLSSARRRLFGSDALRMVYVQLRPGAREAEVRDALRAQGDLRRSTGPDLRIDGQRVIAAARAAAIRPLQRLLYGLGGLSLLVAGVGVTSTMLLSVRERRHEIGIRLAVGARRRSLVGQFLGEAAAVVGGGGALGVALGVAGARGVSAWTRWDAAIAPEVVAVAVGATVLLGLAAGVLPAWRAATIDPVDALAGGSAS